LASDDDREIIGLPSSDESLTVKVIDGTPQLVKQLEAECNPPAQHCRISGAKCQCGFSHRLEWLEQALHRVVDPSFQRGDYRPSVV